MLGQYLVVALLVTGCTVYASWTLMPAGLRRRSATALAVFGWPRPVARWLAKQAAPVAGCAGCERSTIAMPKASAGAPAPIIFHRRPPKRD
jgi:ferrous iron transport protein B